jgi:uncharacterized protein
MNDSSIGGGANPLDEGVANTRVPAIPSSYGIGIAPLVRCRERTSPMDSLGTAVVTGASTGIGAIYADRLARRGYDVVLVARHVGRLQAVAADIAVATGRPAEIVAADLTRGDDLARLEDRLRTDPRLAILVNNAGVAMSGTIAESDPERLEQMLRLNVLVPTRLAAAVVPGFVARGRGTIVNLASAAALAPEWIHGAYSGTKSYLLSLSMKLQQELAGQGVRVQVVLPGAVRTGLWERAGIDLDTLQARVVMDADAMVDAALAGLDAGETVTIPSLPDIADWDAYEAARRALLPKLSRSMPAARYRRPGAQDVGAS